MLDTFDAVAPFITGPQPRPTIADNGSPFRNANPEKFGDGLRVVVERCRSRGYEPAFHNETGTFKEAPEEIEKMLSVSDVGWCLEPVTSLSEAVNQSPH